MPLVTEVETRLDAILQAGENRAGTRLAQREQIRMLHAELLGFIRTISVEDLYALSAPERKIIASNILLRKYTSVYNKLTGLSIALNARVRGEINDRLSAWHYVLNGNNSVE